MYEVNNSIKSADLNEYGMFERQTDFKEQKEQAKENKKRSWIVVWGQISKGIDKQPKDIRFNVGKTGKQ